jgi:uncharacterized spore protein YtfJ
METPHATETLMPFEEVFRSIIEHVGAKTVYGEPISTQGKTIVPVAKVRYGFGGGSGRNDREKHGGGGGGGLLARPVGVVEVTQADTRFIPITSNWPLVGAIALGVGLGMWVFQRIGR